MTIPSSGDLRNGQAHPTIKQKFQRILALYPGNRYGLDILRTRIFNVSLPQVLPEVLTQVLLKILPQVLTQVLPEAPPS